MLVKIIKVILLAILIIVALGWVLWPENWVVRGPIMQAITGEPVDAPSEAVVESRLKVPDGYRIGIYAQGLPGARVMTMTSKGDIIVSLLRTGEVALIEADKNNDGRGDKVITLLTGLNMPSGLTIKNGFLYVAENHQISRFVINEEEKRLIGGGQVIFSGLPEGGNHRTRTIGFGPDGRLYVTVGSSCNVCLETEPYRAEMLIMNGDGSNARTYATGLRNSVGFDWHPLTGTLYANDNGRDLISDDVPNCELNAIVDGGFYGWPYAYDDNVIDVDMGRGHERRVENAITPVHGFGGHPAPLGIRFIRGEGYLQNNALVTLHGSWNRSELSGYKVVALLFDEDGDIMQQDFITGFEKDGDVIGRPVDLIEGRDGAIYVTDDYSGVIYRVVTGDMIVAERAQRNEAKRSDPLAGISSDEVDILALIGQELYSEHSCATCHEEIAGKAALKTLETLSERFTLDDLSALLDVPPGPMPRPDIDDDARRALAVYLMLEKG